MLVLLSDAWIFLKAKHIIFACEDIPSSSCEITVIVELLESWSIFIALSRFPFQSKYISLTGPSHFFQSAHPNNIWKTIYMCLLSSLHSAGAAR